MSNLWKTLGPVIIHRLVLLVCAFVAAHYAFAADAAHKLMTGDTVTLWQGGWTVSTNQIESYILLMIVPAIVSGILAGWERMKSLFALIKARLSPDKLSAAEVKTIVADTPLTGIIKTVVAKP